MAGHLELAEAAQSRLLYTALNKPVRIFSCSVLYCRVSAGALVAAEPNAVCIRWPPPTQGAIPALSSAVCRLTLSLVRWRRNALDIVES